MYTHTHTPACAQIQIVACFEIPEVSRIPRIVWRNLPREAKARGEARGREETGHNGELKWNKSSIGNIDGIRTAVGMANE